MSVTPPADSGAMARGADGDCLPLRSVTPEVRRLFTEGGAEVVTTVTADYSAITFDTYKHGEEVALAINLTENECKTLISNLVASLNAYQRHNREVAHV